MDCEKKNKIGKHYGIVCATDSEAIAVIDALEKRKIVVPSQVMVTGYDDVRMAKNFRIPLYNGAPAHREDGSGSSETNAEIDSGRTGQKENFKGSGRVNTEKLYYRELIRRGFAFFINT